MILLKIPLALLMIVMISVGTYFGHIIGFMATVGATIVLSIMISRWERNIAEWRTSRRNK